MISMKKSTPGVAPGVLAVTLACIAQLGAADFQKTKLESQFLSEGADVGDFNHDGKTDLVAGWLWFEGPAFTNRHEFNPPPAQPFNGEKSYSDYFLTYVYDFNGDKWDDILVFSWPGKEAAWYENPQGRSGHWTKHSVVSEADNESPALADLNGDGKPELLCHTGGRFGFFEADWAQPAQPWRFIAISPEDKKAIFRYTHGYGAGDINGDGRSDILEKNGWWEQPKDYRTAGEWKFHKASFTGTSSQGGAQMLVYDVNGDRLADVITTWEAHGYGIAWYEQVRSGDEISFKEHVLVNRKPEDSKHGVQFTQPHAFTLADINGDGLMDFVTGKRFWAHGPTGDPESGAPAVLYWFELKRTGTTAEFIPHLVDNDSGVGTQITAGDLNADGKLDIISSNKKGLSIFIQKR